MSTAYALNLGIVLGILLGWSQQTTLGWFKATGRMSRLGLIVQMATALAFLSLLAGTVVGLAWAITGAPQ